MRKLMPFRRVSRARNGEWHHFPPVIQPLSLSTLRLDANSDKLQRSGLSTKIQAEAYTTLRNRIVAMGTPMDRQKRKFCLDWQEDTLAL